MIIRGDVLPNERIIESEYAEKLGTNRANIRRALARLEQEELVVIEPFRGARVRLVTPDEAIEIFLVRSVLEVLVAKQAAECATPADVARLDELMHNVNIALADSEPVLVGSMSRKVREEIWRISKNGTAARMIGALHSQLVRIWYQSVMMPGRAQAIAATMQSIVDAIREKDAEKAALAMSTYHEGAVASLSKALQRQAHNDIQE